jgi:threonine dehydrogenase-like Zn-dependent dehydrogenase
MMGAGRVIAIDRVTERLEMAERHGKAEIIDLRDDSVYDRLMELTDGRGPDRCIDAVGAEAHSTGSVSQLYDKAKTMMMMETDRVHVLREAIMCCRPGGTISMPGVYFGAADKIPMGPFMNKGLTLKTGQTHMPKYLDPLLRKVEEQNVDLSFIITHTAPLSHGPELYRTFRDKEDGCIKCVLKPWVH